MDRDIDGLILALKGALEADDENVGQEAALRLLAGALSDLRRRADAAEIIAQHFTVDPFRKPSAAA